MYKNLLEIIQRLTVAKFAISALLLLFSGFMVWAIFVPMDEGAMAYAVVIREGNRKLIQSPDSGFIIKINAKEGKLVKKNEILFEIEALETSFNEATLQAKYAQVYEDFHLTEKKLTSFKELVKDGLVARFEYEQLLAEKNKLEKELASMKEKIRTTKVKKDKLLVRSPIDGQLVDLQIFTEGAVITPSQPLVSVVSENDDIILEAKVAPNDRDVIKIGQHVNVNFQGLSRKSTPYLEGVVISIGDDLALPSSQPSGVKSTKPDAFYTAQIKLIEGQISRLPPGVISSGMSADILFKSKRRTFFEYIISPALSMLDSALREE
jgi:multidrug efflux pump subunit AcrA (membrane-fusion protein)